jgi:anti-anti-sigma regulatory factor
LPITIERGESHSIIRLEGDVTTASAQELKQLLLQGLEAGTDLHVDMERIGDFDITVMQLLWAGGREALGRGIKATIGMTEAAAVAVKEVGFGPLPGLAIQQ